MSIFKKIGRVVSWPVRTAVTVVKGVHTAMNILTLFQGKRTQALLVTLGVLISFVKPWVDSHAPQFSDIATSIIKFTGVLAGATFADKVQRLIEVWKDATAKAG